MSTEPLIETFLNGTWLIEGGSILDGIIDGIKKFVQKDIKDIRDKIYEREQMYFELAVSARSDFERKNRFAY